MLHQSTNNISLLIRLSNVDNLFNVVSHTNKAIFWVLSYSKHTRKRSQKIHKAPRFCENWLVGSLSPNFSERLILGLKLWHFYWAEGTCHCTKVWPILSPLKQSQYDWSLNTPLLFRPHLIQSSPPRKEMRDSNKFIEESTHSNPNHESCE
jgi:hypothetical protein